MQDPFFYSAKTGENTNANAAAHETPIMQASGLMTCR
jgi:hypothetical protein